MNKRAERIEKILTENTFEYGGQKFFKDKRTIVAALAKEVVFRDEVEEELRRARCNYSWDVDGVCELCGAGLDPDIIKFKGDEE